MILSKAILATLAYHDIFDYPLKYEEIRQFLIGRTSTDRQLTASLTKLIKDRKIREGNGHYFLKGRAKIVQKRKLRQKYSQQKLRRAHLYAKLLTLVPTVKLIAISGALAMENSHKNDDIDLVIITAKNTLWTTRFLANLILFPFKRRPFKKTSQLSTLNSQFNNKACLNIFLDESDLKIGPKNLYTAHEITQMKPLLDRNETYSRVAPVNASKNIKRSLSVYSRFIKANNWIKNYLPNWLPYSHAIPTSPVIPANEGIQQKGRVRNWALVSDFCQKTRPNWQLAESFLKKLQLAYMKSKITTERIGKYQLFFHPANTQQYVLTEYNKKLKKLRIRETSLRSSSGKAGLRA